ncbi:unnamed protein product [Brachionus calyciflorus]|uniref:Uncharacterized protein n=1 Tax=Brachionus calyciflorus TaxID=104777 RepID=A0A814B1S6_9BILA|nr:unnamed protein product [Brachionus calyciflorus]
MSNEENRASVKLLNTNQILIQDFFSNLSKFYYDKARAVIEKSKESSKVWSIFQTALTNFALAEKNYNNLIFISQRPATRIGDRYYESAFTAFEQINKETFSLRSNSLSTESPNLYDTLNELSHQLISLIEFRYQMISLYSELKDKEMRQEKDSIELSLKNLNDLKQKYLKNETSPLIESLKHVFDLEMNLLTSLLTCHSSLDYKLDCIKAIISIKKINNIFNSEHIFQASKTIKEIKSFSLFSRATSQQRQQPALFQWFKIYYQALLNKFSILMHDSFSQIHDVSHVMNDKIPIYNQLISFINKYTPFLTGIILDTTLSGSTNFRGSGYEFVDIQNHSKNKSGIDQFPFVFSYPKLKNIDYEKHVKNFAYLVKEVFDSKVKYYYDQNLKSSYYLYKISDYYTLVVLFEVSKQENKTKVASILQEIGDDLNMTNVFGSFNQNLK